MSVTLPELVLPPSSGITTRGLLADSRANRGRNLKLLRKLLQEQPNIRKRFLQEKHNEEENSKHAESLNFSKIAESRVKRTQNDFVLASTFTNPLNNATTTPPISLNEEYEMRVKKEQERKKAGKLTRRELKRTKTENNSDVHDFY